MGAAANVLSRVSRLIPRRLPGRSTGLYVAWTVGWFVVFLMITFPHDLVLHRWVDRLEEQSGWKIQYREIWLRPWSGYHFSDFRLIAPGKDPEPWVTAAQVALRPSLTALLVGNPFPLRFSLDAYGGNLSGWLSKASPPTLDVSWSRIDLSAYPRMSRILEGAWSGELSGEMHFAGQDAKDLEGQGKLGLRNGSLTHAKAQGFTIPDLHFATGAAELEVKGGKIDVKSLKLSGTEIEADLRGQLFLPAPNAVPVINGTVSLKPLPGAPPGLDALLTIANHNQKPPNGVYTFTLYGSLNQLRVR